MDSKAYGFGVLAIPVFGTLGLRGSCDRTASFMDRIEFARASQGKQLAKEKGAGDEPAPFIFGYCASQ
jgi:hypothetical protein